MAKSRSETASRLLGITAVEAERRGDLLAIDGKAGARQRARAERQAIDAPSGIGQTFAVPVQHPEIGEQMVRQHDRLRVLKMREAGQNGLDLSARHGRAGSAASAASSLDLPSQSSRR